MNTELKVLGIIDRPLGFAVKIINPRGQSRQKRLNFISILKYRKEYLGIHLEFRVVWFLLDGFVTETILQDDISVEKYFKNLTLQ